MKFCGSCGSELTEDVAFCSKCGAKVVEQPVVAEENVVPTQGESQPVQSSKDKMPKNKKMKIIIASAAAALVLIIGLIVGLLIFSSAQKTVSVKELVTVEFYGGDGSGMADAYLDEYSFTEAVMKAAGIKINYEDLLDLAGDSGEYALIYDLYESVELKLDKDSGLSNGDKVKVTFTYDEAIAKQLKIKIKNTEMTFKVAELKQLENINPFDYLTVSFTGTAPYISVELDYDGEDGYLSSYSFIVENDGYINLGDEVKISIDESSVEGMASYGYGATKTSKNYTCENADAYIQNLDSISEANLAAIKEIGKVYVEAYFAQNNSYIACTGLTYSGMYVLMSKEENWYQENSIYVIYSGTVSSLEGNFEPKLVYFPVKISDAIVLADGTLTYDDYYTEIEGSTTLEFDWFGTVDGYESPDTMYTEIITANKTEYDCYVSPELE